MKNIKKKQHSHVPFMLLDIILTRWRNPMASSEALDLLHQAMHVVEYRRIAMAIKTASFVGVFVDCYLFACCPGGRSGDTERAVARWRRQVASGVAGHAALGDALRIAPADRHGHRNGQRQRNILMPLSILSSTITIAKDHVMVH